MCDARLYCTSAFLLIKFVLWFVAALLLQEAHESGIALVVACAQDKAENYVEGLRLNGLISTMEPGA